MNLFFWILIMPLGFFGGLVIGAIKGAAEEANVMISEIKDEWKNG